MKTILLTQISIPFIIVVIVTCLIALAIAISMRNQNKKDEVDLTQQQRKELERLNSHVERLEYLIKESKAAIHNRDTDIISLKSKLSASERMIKLRDIEIARLKNELENPKVTDVTLKIGDTVTGRVVPNSKKIVTGKIKRLTKRGNYVLDSGQTISKDEAVFVG